MTYDIEGDGLFHQRELREAVAGRRRVEPGRPLDAAPTSTSTAGEHQSRPERGDAADDGAGLAQVFAYWGITAPNQGSNKPADAASVPANVLIAGSGLIAFLNEYTIGVAGQISKRRFRVDGIYRGT